MKKIFTLIAVAMMAVGVNAQGTYAVMDGAAGVAAGSQITSVKNITMTWGVAGGADFKGGNKKSEVLKDFLGATGYCEGNGENGKIDAGTVYIFEPASDGNLNVGFVLNAGKKFWVKEADGTDVKFTMTESDTTTPVVIENGGTLANKLTGGIVKFEVKNGKKYSVYCEGSKLGFFGFKFEITSTGISDINSDAADVNAPAYNLAGQRVNANAKGLVIKNGKKYVNK